MHPGASLLIIIQYFPEALQVYEFECPWNPLSWNFAESIGLSCFGNIWQRLLYGISPGFVTAGLAWGYVFPIVFENHFSKDLPDPNRL